MKTWKEGSFACAVRGGLHGGTRRRRCGGSDQRGDERASALTMSEVRIDAAPMRGSSSWGL
jgi:hypothetical protein